MVSNQRDKMILNYKHYPCMSRKAVCIFSGGLDSTCTLAYVKNDGYQVYALTFRYGQMSEQEVNTAESLAGIIGVEEHKIIDISFMKELYKESRNVLTHSNDINAIPSTFDYSIVVPIRNAVFLTIASAYAFSINATLIVYGAHKDDSIHYPDCRVEFISSIEHALNLAEVDGIKQGIRNSIRIWSPAVEGLGKADLIKIGYKLIGDNIFRTWSCYTNGVLTNSMQRVHCGRCESCNNRKRAFLEAGVKDMTIYAYD
jgi:7-cyano-7-deazaguanine synthase